MDTFQNDCCLTPYEFQIAIRDIEPGEEITDDYGYLNIIEPFEADAEGGDRTVVYPDDLLRYAKRWDRQLATAFPEMMQVAQPLQKFLPEKTWKTMQAIDQGEIKRLSISTCYSTGG